jgi:hypothetical protein
MVSGPRCLFSLYDDQDNIIIKNFDSTMFTREPYSPFPILPCLRLPAGTRMRLTMKLADDVNIGRKRPIGEGIIIGSNLYAAEPQ